MRHGRADSLRTMTIACQFTDGPAIRLVQFHAEMRVIRPTHRRLSDDERAAGGRNQQHDEFHTDGDEMRAPQTSTAVRHILSHAAGVKNAIRVIHRAGQRGPHVASFV